MAHGGDQYRNKVKIDFSVNINPLGIPEGVMRSLSEAAACADRYPDPENEALVRGITGRLSVPADQVICGNGASELIMAVMHALRPEKVLLPVPSFSGYERATEAVDSDIIYFKMPEEHLQIDESVLSFIKKEHESGKNELLILCNPNNPTGSYIDNALLRKMLSLCEINGIRVLLDESFMELSDDPESNSSLGELADCPGLMILRSFTKSFAIPGVRLGYLLCGSRDVCEQISKHLPEWNLSVQAQMAGLCALNAAESLCEARALISRERRYLSDSLEGAGFRMWHSDVNFLLFRLPEGNAADLYRELLKRGILIRKCDDFAGLGGRYYRIAVRKHEDNVILIRSISEIMERSR